MATTEAIVTTTRFVLLQTHHAGNVGAAARSLKTMGFEDLVLVAPRDPKVLNRVRTKEGASGATDVLGKARICTSVEEALEGTNIWCATGMPNDMYRERPKRVYSAPRPYFEQLLKDGKNVAPVVSVVDPAQSVPADKELDDIRIAFLFGNERVGMKDEDIDRCHVVLGIPTNPAFGSLNLASAVQLIAYDWREAMGGFRIR